MRIVPLDVFLDGHERFKPRRVYEVRAERGSYFISHGWARHADKKEYRWYRKVRKSG